MVKQPTLRGSSSGKLSLPRIEGGDDADSATRALDGLKLMSDWSKWLTTLVTTSMTLGGFWISVHGKELPVASFTFLRVALWLFFLSIVCASVLLYKLPGVVANLPHEESRNIYDMGKWHENTLTTGKLVWWQQAYFLCGMGCLAIGVLASA